MIGVIRTGTGNVTSVCDALDRLGLSWTTLEQPALEGITRIVIPGQGRFGTVMSTFDHRGWVKPIREWIDAGHPLVGICVGMQVLFDESDEDAGVAGLGVLPGRVETLDAPRRPIMGWAKVHWTSDLHDDGDAYFVNSFAVKVSQHETAISRCPERFVAAVRRGNLYGFQFHPEKSGRWGKELLARCLC